MGNTIISSKVTADKDRDLQVVPRVQEVRLVASKLLPFNVRMTL